MTRRTVAGRKKAWPLPVDTLFHHPIWRASSCATRGMILSLLEHYWMTERRPLPTDRNQLFAIARGHPRTWRANRDDILRVVADCTPELDAYAAQRAGGESGLRAMAYHARQASQAKARAQRLDSQRADPATIGPAHVTGELPRTAPPARPRPREDRPRAGFHD